VADAAPQDVGDQTAGDGVAISAEELPKRKPDLLGTDLLACDPSVGAERVAVVRCSLARAGIDRP
jgi:hypothetical protein